MKTNIYSSKEEFEAKHPYVLVEFNTYENQTIATVFKSFTSKKVGENYIINNGLSRASNLDLMTRTKYDKIICSLA